MHKLKKLIEVTWDGDISFEDAVRNLTSEQLEDAATFVDENWDLLKYGVPFPEDSAEWAELLATDSRATILQGIVDEWE